MSNPVVREKLARKEFFVAPGINDMATAAIANAIGFDIVYGTGFWLTASLYGLPDAGLASYTQMLEAMATLVRTSKGAVIADADTGYGGLLNVHHTVRGYEAAGVSAIQIEDQEFPKKCGHTPNKRVIPLADMVEKVKVACAARLDALNTLIIARTDARAVEGFDASLRRAEAYAAAGADIIFLEALTSDEEMVQACKVIGKPMMVNMADGGKTPIRSAAVLKEMGFAFAIYPSTAGLAAAAATAHALRVIKETGSSRDPDLKLFDFEQFCRLIGFAEVWEFEAKWARPEGSR